MPGPPPPPLPAQQQHGTAELFLATLPLLLRCEAAVQALGEGGAGGAVASCAAWPLSPLHDALLRGYAPLAAALCTVQVRAVAARAHARVACVCCDARRVADADGVPPAMRAMLAARARAAADITAALTTHRLLPRAAPELVYMLLQRLDPA